MRTWLSYLLDGLEDLAPACAPGSSLPAHTPRVASVRVYRPGAPLAENCLYLCREPIPPTEDRPEGCWFLCPASDRPAVPGCWYLTDPPEPEVLLDRLLTLVGRYQDWYDAMMELAMAYSPLQTLVDTSEDMLENPIIILDSSFTMVAITRSASVNDYPYFDFTGTKKPLPEFLLELEPRMPTDMYYPMDDGDTYEIARRGGTPELSYSVNGAGGSTLLRIDSIITRSPRLTQGYKDLFYDFCRFARRSLDIAHLKTAASNLSGYAVDQLLTHDDPTALTILLQPAEGDSFAAGVYDTRSDRTLRMAAQIQELIPRSAFFPYHDRIAFVLCVNGSDRDAAFSEYQYQRLQAVGDQIGAMCALSYQQPGLTCVKEQLRQAERTHRLWRQGGERSSRFPRLRFYDDAALADLADAFFQAEEFTARLPRELAAIYAADLAHRQNNCLVLYHYLLSGRSLATASRALHMHRNTIVYRLERMQDSYGLRLDDPARNQLYLLCAMVCKDHLPDAGK